MITQPSRLTFWRWVLAVTSLLAWLSLRDAFALAHKLKLVPLASKTWLMLLGVLALTGAVSLVLLALSFSAAPASRERWLDRLEFITRTPLGLRPVGYILLFATLALYPLVMFHPYYGDLLSGQGAMRLFIFWLAALAGAFALKLARPQMGWLAALLLPLMFETLVQRVALYLPDISAYPFAMGWSETSRFYYPSLFIGRQVFGETQTWPILHPTLHFLLIPPYLVNAPLWFHRFWQVALRFLLVGLIAPPLLRRINLPASRALRWLLGLAIFLVMFTLPLYLHLAVPVILVLWGFSADDDRRTWFWLVLASIWAGLSRLNWYPVPGMLAAALYFLEVPAEKRGWPYLIKPALWFVISTALAFLSMQIYILVSGISARDDFYTSLSSSLLWDRLLPNASYPLGVLPGIAIFSAPFWLVMFFAWRRSAGQPATGWPPALQADRRALFLCLELLVLFAGGLVVSMKIGGGADIHNLDAYAVLLLVITAYLLFGPRQMGSAEPPKYHWSVWALLVLVPAWFSVQSTAAFWQYDPKISQATLLALQQQVDDVNAQGKEILFITQRHLISMHMLKGVQLVPEYEREELMEMAMAQNDTYLSTFRNDLENHRFGAILVDPLRFNLVGEQDAMGAENNAWTRSVVRKILCNYREAALFPSDRIAIYVPQIGAQRCP